MVHLALPKCHIRSRGYRDYQDVPALGHLTRPRSWQLLYNIVSIHLSQFSYDALHFRADSVLVSRRDSQLQRTQSRRSRICRFELEAWSHTMDSVSRLRRIPVSRHIDLEADIEWMKAGLNVNTRP